MRTLISCAFAIFLLPLASEAQAVRYDNFASTTSPQCASGRACPLNVLPGTSVVFCTGNAIGTANTSGTVVTSTSGPSFTGASGNIQINGASYTIQTVVSSTIIVLTSSAGAQTGVSYSTLSGCQANPATTYTNSGAGTACPTTAQLTPQLGGSCITTADSQGNYGAWILPGSYYYYLAVPPTAGGQITGPYAVSIGASSGCPLNTTCDANYLTLAAACSAAGSGLLYVTRAWNGLSTQIFGCPMFFTGTGRIQPASGQIVTISGAITAAATQIFDVSTGGSISVTNIDVPTEWFGTSSAAFGYACNAVHSGAVVVSRTLALSTMTCSAPVQFANGGRIQPSSGQTVTLSPNIHCGPSQQCFDVHLGGSITFSGFLSKVTPQNFGALGNNSNDDTAAFQAAMDTVCYTGSCQAEIELIGQYYTSSQLNGYNSGTSTSYNGLNLKCGSQSYGICGIYYHGSSSGFALRTIGKYTRITGLYIEDDNSSGWVAGYAYDGSSSIGISTSGLVEQLFVNCNNHGGDGVQVGPGHFQADQAQWNKLVSGNCLYGSAFNVVDANALSHILYSPTIFASHLGLNQSTSSVTTSVYGGEFDDNDINFKPNIGASLMISGVRSETSKRQIFTSGALNQIQAVTLDSYSLALTNDQRSATTTTAASTATTITVSTSANFIEGDGIVIAGAGTAGADLHVYVSNVGGTTLNQLVISSPIVTSVTGAAVTLDSSIQQSQFWLQSAGPYNIRDNYFSGTTTSGLSNYPVTFRGATNATFDGNIWDGYGLLQYGPLETGTCCANGMSVMPNNVVNLLGGTGTPHYMPINIGGQVSILSGPTTFTPSLKFGGASTGITYSSQVGDYVSQCAGSTCVYTVNIVLSLTSKGSSTGQATITGAMMTPGASLVNGILVVGNAAATQNSYQAQITSGSPTVFLYGINTSQSRVNLTDADFTNTSVITVSITYHN